MHACITVDADGTLQAQRLLRRICQTYHSAAAGVFAKFPRTLAVPQQVMPGCQSVLARSSAFGVLCQRSAGLRGYSHQVN